MGKSGNTTCLVRALVALTEELPDASLLPDAVAWNACAAACASPN